MTKSLYDILLDVSKSSMIDNGDLNAAGLLILTAAIDGLQINRAGVWLFSEDKQVICGKMLIDGDECELDTSLCLARSDFPHYFDSLDSERAVVANDAHTDPCTAEFSQSYLTPLGITSMLDAPIRHRGKMLGIICCEHQGERRSWTNEEIAFASALADTYGRAVSAAQRNDYERQLKEINEQLEQKVNERTNILQEALRNLNHTQAKLIESEKLASLGRLVSGLAHEINTPLGIAVTSSSHCLSELKRVQALYKDEALNEAEFAQFLAELDDGLGLINNNLSRATTLVHNFKLSGSIHASTEEEQFELRSCIDLTLKSLQPLLKKNHIDCQLMPSAEIALNSYPGAIAQIITNLITNSIHHAFSHAEHEHKEKQIRIQLTQTAEQITLHYRDNGCGIAPDIRPQIFEPFFTTARRTGGSGLGLSIVYNLVTQKLGGDIVIDEDQSHGASFRIDIPCHT
ncbi:GAF domain-containing sensor histidine kinase [Cellvibrio sp. OA-2007]|uniref:GAF domain-containing sensor histidine kinase n=1 Tax=Cellvibrio sp. OA-2007 TaxID=529823 RepID=UPI00078591E0|nr:GAF domain-containing sensor histidine kinase [Cellvibrio sp. OA-2007]